MDATATAETLREQLRLVKGRSALYERLLAGFAGAAERGFDGGVLGRLLRAPGPSSPAEARLLILAALHHAALADPSLPHAAWFPAAVPEARNASDGAPSALALAYLVEHEAIVTAFLAEHRLQTNEVGRCAVLLPGFLEAASFGRPLRLLELGASAGLNLHFDRYRYRYQDGPGWGPTGGPELRSRAEGAVPRALAPPTVDVAERVGVDLAPLDPADADDRRVLTSFVWADETDRIDRLRHALDVAASTPARLERGDLVAWAVEHGRAEAGVTTVLFHSQVRHLLADEEVGRLSETVETGLRSGTPDGPFVYLSFEAPRGVPDDGSNWPELTVATSGGDGPPSWRTVCSADWHGHWVRWF